MAQDYIPSNDREFLAWAQNFLEVATEFKDELAITPVQLQEIADMIAELNNNIGTADNITQQAKTAVRNKNTSHERLEDRLRTLARQYKVKPELDNNIIMGLRLPPNETSRTYRAPQMPDDVIAKRDADGSVHIEWDAAGNPPGTQYIIEKRIGTQSEFIMIGTTTRRSYNDRTAIPGETVTYRIIAQRADTLSIPSMTVTVER